MLRNRCIHGSSSQTFPSTLLLFVMGVCGLFLLSACGSSLSPSSTPTISPSLGSWAVKASMPMARSAPAVGVIGGILYSVGGNGAGLGLLSNVEAYNPSTDTWTEDAPLLKPDSGLTAGVVNGKLYAIGYQ